MDQGSTRKRSAVHNFAPTVTKFCVMWEGQALPHDTKFGNSRCEIVGRRVIFIRSLIHGLSWSGLIKAEPGAHNTHCQITLCFTCDTALHLTIKYMTADHTNICYTWMSSVDTWYSIEMCKHDRRIVAISRSVRWHSLFLFSPSPL